MRTEIIVVNNFYEDPERIVKYALSLQYYYPYLHQTDKTEEVRRGWMSSYFKQAKECPFKSSGSLVKILEDLVGEEIDPDHWTKDFPVDENQNLLTNHTSYDRTCRWNCCFHVKLKFMQRELGMHNHVTDTWNSVGELGWAGIIYLNKTAPIESGLKLWRNKFGQDYEWMSEKERWELIDSLGNIYNRLILCRGYMPHSGGPGFGDSIHNGRLFQTFFFKTKTPRAIQSFDPELPSDSS